MEKLRVEESFGPNEIHFDDLLYNSPNFLDINNDLPQKHFYLFQGTKILGHVAFSTESGIAHSHIKAPFGGFNFSMDVKSEDQIFFIIEVIRRFSHMGITEIRLLQAPEIEPRSSLARNLDILGFVKREERTYQMIPITDVEFFDQVHVMEQRKLKKANELGFEIEWVGDAHLKSLFDFILEQRQEKGFSFSMNWEMLKDYKEAFPKNYLGICVRHEGQVIAATLLIKEKDNVIYNFSPAHLMKYNRYSPIVFLTQAIYRWCQKEGYEYLNLGTSYLGDESNEGLFTFKEKLGAKAFVATTYQKVLNS